MIFIDVKMLLVLVITITNSILGLEDTFYVWW